VFVTRKAWGAARACPSCSWCVLQSTMYVVCVLREGWRGDMCGRETWRGGVWWWAGGVFTTMYCRVMLCMTQSFCFFES
jgi:hypothetical protein